MKNRWDEREAARMVERYGPRVGEMLARTNPKQAQRWAAEAARSSSEPLAKWTAEAGISTVAAGADADAILPEGDGVSPAEESGSVSAVPA